MWVGRAQTDRGSDRLQRLRVVPRVNRNAGEAEVGAAETRIQFDRGFKFQGCLFVLVLHRKNTAKREMRVGIPVVELNCTTRILIGGFQQVFFRAVVPESHHLTVSQACVRLRVGRIVFDCLFEQRLGEFQLR